MLVQLLTIFYLLLDRVMMRSDSAFRSQLSPEALHGIEIAATASTGLTATRTAINIPQDNTQTN